MIKIPISRVKGLVINMNVGNRLLLVKYKERRKMELSENMLGNGRYVVKFGGKQYQYVGYHREKGYLIICSAFLEEGFTIGREFKHEIPIIKNMNYDLKDDLYYKKVMPEEIEDVYYVFVMEKYCGYRCEIRKQSEGTFSVFITGDEKEDSNLLNLGFKSELDADHPWHEYYWYKKEIDSIDDDNVQITAIKSYMPQDVDEPFASMKRKEYSTSTELKIDVKAIYRTIAKELKDLV